MSHRFALTATSSLPPAEMTWKVDIGDDPQDALVYTNLAYDLIAASMAKLGVEFSKYLGDKDGDRLAHEVKHVQEVLRAGTVAG